MVLDLQKLPKDEYEQLQVDWYYFRKIVLNNNSNINCYYCKIYKTHSNNFNHHGWWTISPIIWYFFWNFSLGNVLRSSWFCPDSSIVNTFDVLLSRKSNRLIRSYILLLILKYFFRYYYLKMEVFYHLKWVLIPLLIYLKFEFCILFLSRKRVFL